MNDDLDRSSQEDSQDADESESVSDCDSIGPQEESKGQQLPMDSLKRGRKYVKMPPLKKIMEFKIRKVFVFLTQLP